MSVELLSFTGRTIRLFVYGTLMRDGCRSRALAGQRFLGAARTRSAYALLDLGDYPGLVPQEPGGRSVRGELYEVDAKLIPVLDRIEGAPALFRLGRVDLEGEPDPVFAYLYQPNAVGFPECAGERWENSRPQRRGAGGGTEP